MKRAAAFFIAAVTILLLSFVVIGGKSILTAGIVAVLVGLAFAAFPAEGMSIIGFIVCAPVVAVQIAVGVPSLAVWLAVCGAVVFAPPAFGLVSFIGIRKGWGDPAAVLFLVSSSPCGWLRGNFTGAQLQIPLRQCPKSLNPSTSQLMRHA